MHTIYHIFPVIPIKDLINEDGDPTTQHKLETGTKPSVSYLHVLFCPCVVRKATAHVETKTLNMRHQAQKGFRGIFVGIAQYQKGYLVYVPNTRKVIFSYDVVFDESFSSALSYTSRPYAEAMSTSSILVLPKIWSTCSVAIFTSDPNKFTPDSNDPFCHLGLGLINLFTSCAIVIKSHLLREGKAKRAVRHVKGC